MSFQLPRALFLKAARPVVRVTGRNAGRRTMSNAAHASQPKSDKPWIIGSTIVFGSAAVYLVSPPGKQKAHEAKEAALPKEPSPDPDSAPVPTGNESETSPPESQPEATVSDDEGNQAPASEVTDSINKALEEDALKTAQAAEAHSAEKQENHTSSSPDAATSADTSSQGSTAGEAEKKDEEPKKEDSS